MSYKTALTTGFKGKITEWTKFWKQNVRYFLKKESRLLVIEQRKDQTEVEALLVAIEEFKNK